MTVVRRPIPNNPPQSPDAFAQEMRDGCAGLMPSLPKPQPPKPQP